MLVTGPHQLNGDKLEHKDLYLPGYDYFFISPRNRTTKDVYGLTKENSLGGFSGRTFNRVAPIVCL